MWDFYQILKKYSVYKKRKNRPDERQTTQRTIKKIKEERDRIEKETGSRPQIDQST